MSTAVTTEARRYTPDDLLAMHDGKSYELVNGRLVKRNMGAESSAIGGNLYFQLRLHCRDHDLGIVWPADNGYQCFPHAPRRVRRPDVSFVKKGRLPGDVAPKGWVRIVPDLVVEVISPNDSVEEFEEKLEDYAKAGVPLVWVLYPERRKARVFHGDGSLRLVAENDELTGDDVLPGFRCRLGDLLPPPAPAEEPAAQEGAGPG